MRINLFNATHRCMHPKPKYVKDLENNVSIITCALTEKQRKKVKSCDNCKYHKVTKEDTFNLDNN